jgi:hypothetical protein
MSEVSQSQPFFAGELVGPKLAKALLAAQKSIESASKDSTNPHYKNNYASLESVIDAVKEHLNAQGIVFMQAPVPTDNENGETLGLLTMLIHESGESLSGTAVIPLQKNDPQGYGSALTYARRYSLAAITGLKTLDDDAEAAVGRGSVNNTSAATAKPAFSLGTKTASATAAKAPAKGKTGMFPNVGAE